MNRRRFVHATGSAFGMLTAAGWRGVDGATSGGVEDPDVDAFIHRKMQADHIPGVAAAIVDRDGIVWAKGYGWADLEARQPMTVDNLQNIASISKTFTTTAIMQLHESGVLELDADVNEYLPFELRNPAHPDVPISVRHLMTHVSSLRDGTAYSRLYACGDPKVSLGVWMRNYFTPGALYYSAAENFEAWGPGEQWRYCNVSYGLLGLIVEQMSGLTFRDFCRQQIFLRLGMTDTDWFLSEIDPTRHVVPYTWFDDGVARGPTWGGLPLGVIRDEGTATASFVDGGYRANCPYNHPNYPDGFLRTSVRQLASYAVAYLNGGLFGNNRILSSGTIAAMLTEQRPLEGRVQGLTWFGSRRSDGEWTWGHGGSDPGVNTHFEMMMSRGVAAIVFANTNGVRPQEITALLLEAAYTR